jgi:deoxyxylulose-5-phosphate synthase
LNKALFKDKSIAAVRYPRGLLAEGQYHGEWRLFDKGTKKLIITYGRIVGQLSAFDSDLLQLIRIMPLPKETIEIAAKYDDIVFYEEGNERGGIGEAFLLELYRRGWRGEYDVKAYTDFVPCADVHTQLSRLVPPVPPVSI